MTLTTRMALALLLPLLAAGWNLLFGRRPNLRETSQVLTALLLFGVVCSLAPATFAGARPELRLFELLPDFVSDQFGFDKLDHFFTSQQQQAHGILVRHFRCCRPRSRADRLYETELSVRVDVADQTAPSPHHHRQIGFGIEQPVVDSPGHGVTEKCAAAGLWVGTLIGIVEV